MASQGRIDDASEMLGEGVGCLIAVEMSVVWWSW